VYLNKSRLRLELCFLSAAIVMVIGLITFLITKHSFGPIGDSPLLDQTSSKRTTKEIAVYVEL
jgi:POT family proton-dependent oligopeptide transporter